MRYKPVVRGMLLIVVSVMLVAIGAAAEEQPEIFFLDATIHGSNNSVVVHTFEVSEGRPQILQSGPYTAQLVNASGGVHYEQDFVVGYVQSHPPNPENATVTSERIPLRFPYMYSAETIRILNDGNVIHELDISEQLCNRENPHPQYCERRINDSNGGNEGGDSGTGGDGGTDDGDGNGDGGGSGDTDDDGSYWPWPVPGGDGGDNVTVQIWTVENGQCVERVVDADGAPVTPLFGGEQECRNYLEGRTPPPDTISYHAVWVPHLTACEQVIIPEDVRIDPSYDSQQACRSAHDPNDTDTTRTRIVWIPTQDGCSQLLSSSDTAVEPEYDSWSQCNDHINQYGPDNIIPVDWIPEGDSGFISRVLSILAGIVEILRELVTAVLS